MERYEVNKFIEEYDKRVNDLYEALDIKNKKPKAYPFLFPAKSLITSSPIRFASPEDVSAEPKAAEPE